MPRLTGFPRVPVPGPAPIPLLGHVPRVLQFLGDPVGAVARLRAYGDVVSVARDNPALVCVFGAARNREVLGSPSDFPHDEFFIRGAPGSPLDRMSKVIIAINGDLHRRHRRLLMPAFTRAALDGYAAEIVRVCEALVDRWPAGGVADLRVLTRDLALAIAVRTLFGLDVLAGLTGLGELAASFVETFASPGAIVFPFDLPGTPYRRASRLGARMIAELEALIARKRAGGAGEGDALSLLLRAGDGEGAPFSDDELISETSTLFIAGHETTAATLMWTLFLLERHPDVLAAVLDEIDGAIGGRSMTAADIPRMPLVDRVIKESMRVLAPVPILFLRVPREERALGGVRLPAGANVVVSPYATHHDPALFPDPERFDPARWEAIKPTSYEYLPFGAGPRTCIGAAFSQQALRIAVPVVLQRRRIAVAPGHDVSRITRGNIMTARRGVPVHLRASHRERVEPAPIRGDVHEMVRLPRA